MHWGTLLWVGVGSAAGGMLRYLLAVGFAVRVGTAFPWGTIAANILGSFLIGLVGGLAEPGGPRSLALSPETRQFLMIGVLGGFTTFSSFSLQTVILMRDGHHAAALANVGISVLVCLAAAGFGLVLGERIG